MAFEKTLLERIDEPDDPGSRRVSVDPYRVSQSVLDHLRKMLNVRQGSTITLPDYGMPDFNDVSATFPDGILVLRKVIKDSLEKYEPRLRNVNVRYVPNEDNPLDLRFEIGARLVLDGTETPITFETSINDSGQVRVRG